jgi:spore coat polysaccharide biosynthesis protein SpsF
MKVVGTIEARMGSSRLPGKTLMPVWKEKCLLELVVTRFRLAGNLEEVWVATTVEAADDPIAYWCESHGVQFHRGPEMDVLERVAGAALKAGADLIVQMGADSAYLDFQLIDRLVSLALAGDYDYVCNDLQLTYPLGIYGHVVRVAALAELNTRINLTDEEREDVVRYIWEHPELYRIKNITAPAELAYPRLRFTVDYPEDMEQAQTVYRLMGKVDFTTPELIALYKSSPALFEKTANLVQHSAPFLKKEAHE